ncbi:MAG TPA: lytic transglycosylase domain-containing protein [Coriobacteriia bacterium]|nr:lytic transglycosylase domain-containing protein [Coriobacteriia bacterium]
MLFRIPRPWYRAALIGVIALLAVLTFLFLRGPAVWQRQYYPLKYEAAIEESALRHRVSPYLIASVIEAESNWDPSARSAVGAVGLMQVMPSTADELARRELVDEERYPTDELSDVEVNIEYGAAYLRYLVERYHEIEIALAAYNAGLANADSWVRQGEDIRETIEFPETRHFVLKVSRGKDRYEALYPDAFSEWRNQ